MPDIFISYSRKDSEAAEQLAELLASAGLSVWIDKSGIDVATSWSGEIVDAIEGCKAFVLLLSTASTESTNVHKEVSLASERKKKILPLDLEPVQLTRDLAYHLAGIQRAPMTNIDAIIRALAKLGIEATGAPQPPKIEKTSDGKKSLMILPFEDLSPTADNAWFADGIVSELIAALSNVKALKLADSQATKEFRQYHGQLSAYAREMGIRYFVQGDVRKFGDQIKINSRLLDIETGDHLWQDSMKGTMSDVFDMQEKVAESVVEGLKVHLASDEKKKLAERGTENAEAYELYLKANEYYLRQTRDGCRHGIQLITLALELDSNYVNALIAKAGMLVALYRNYDRDPNLLVEGEQLTKRTIEIKSDSWVAYSMLSNIYRNQGRIDEAEEAVKEYVRRAPESYHSHFCLGLFYAETDQAALAIPPYEKSIELRREQKRDDLITYFNIVISSDRAQDTARVEKWSRLALPLYERRLRLVPDDENAKVTYASLLAFAGEPKRGIEALAPLLEKQNLDGASLYNVACIYARMNDAVHAMESLRRSIATGFQNIDTFRTDPDLDPLRTRDDFKELIAQLSEAGSS